MIRKRNLEAEAEYDRLKQHYPALRNVGMSGTAILAAWFLCGDDMWTKPEIESEVKESENVG